MDERRETENRAIDSAGKPSSAPLLTVIIPVYNEAATLLEVIRRLEQLDVSLEILIVNDASTDGTAQQVHTMNGRGSVRTLNHERNLGKGAAIRTGMGHARGSILVIQDADLEYDPEDIEQLITPITEDRADVVFGSRCANFPNAKWVPTRHLANRGLTWLSNRFTRLNLTDMETCYKAMRREVAASISIREDRFGVEPELTAKIARGGWRVVETPISYHPRDYAAGKKIGFRDGLRAVWCILRYSRWD